MSKLRQGDLFLFQTNDGGEISVKNGEPVMDGGLQTAMYLSLFGDFIDEKIKSKLEIAKKEWWGNEYLDEVEQLKSEFYSFIKGKPKSVQNILKAEELAKKDLQWFIDTDIADEIVVDITSNDIQKIIMDVKILADGETIEENEFEINWGFEKNDPANARV